jgi:hypothetical protein
MNGQRGSDLRRRFLIGVAYWCFLGTYCTLVLDHGDFGFPATPMGIRSLVIHAILGNLVSTCVLFSTPSPFAVRRDLRLIVFIILCTHPISIIVYAIICAMVIGVCERFECSIVSPIVLGLAYIWVQAMLQLDRRAEVSSKSVCAQCGYDCRGLQVCPECGTPLTE